MLYPATEEVLAPQSSATVWFTCGATPVPLSATALAPVPLLAIVTEPLAEPATVGANCTPTDVLWFGESVTAPPPLAMLKPAPVALMPVIETFELPVLVTLKLCDAVEPLFTEPKLRLPGFTLSV